MTPKEKAKKLVDKFYYGGYKKPMFYDNAKQCALIAVDEILKSHHNLYGVNNKEVKFYSEVIQEIEVL